MIAQATQIADKLSQAQDVQQVLAWVVAILCVSLVGVVGWHLKERSRWDTMHLALTKRGFRSQARSSRAMEALAGIQPPDDEGTDEGEP